MEKKQLLTLVILIISLAFYVGCGGQTMIRAENEDTTNGLKQTLAKDNNSKAEIKSKSENLSPTNKSQIVMDIKKIHFENFTFNIRGEKVRLKNGSQIGACKNA